MSQPGSQSAGGLQSLLGGVVDLRRSPELIIALSVVGMIVMMVLPLPAMMLDFLLAISMSMSLIVLLISIYVASPMEFASFPTVLLLTTLFRLSLNVATTRGILLNGASQDGLSKLIVAFGNLVVGGQFAIGFVIFAILMIINFVVITKGSGRIAEVAARFTLDAMPGKQMAIDAELNAGHISPEVARKRRDAVGKEADFYGAMDGASKFVRGDAIAGIIITLVNMIVGLLVGIIQHGMPAAEAATRFTLLSVGDGLISALPALMVSTAAGIIVTRATSEGNLGSELLKQVRVHPKAFYVASGLVFFLALLPGFPKLAFFALAALLGWIGYLSQTALDNEHNTTISTEEAKVKANRDAETESLDALMRVDSLAIEVGHALVTLIDPAQDGEVVDRIQSIRKQFAQELGIIVPQVQLRDNLQLGPGQYAIMLKGSKITTGNLMVDYFLAMDPGNVELPIEGEETTDPVYGLNAIWVHRRDKDEAVFRGYTVVNCATVMATHLTKIVREHAADLITRQDIQYLIDRLKETNPKVIEEVIHPERLTVGDVVKVCQRLLVEEISVRDSLTIFECLADYCRQVRNPDILAEYCRKALSRTIIERFLTDYGQLQVVSFDRTIEDILGGGLVVTENGSMYLNLEATAFKEILDKLRSDLELFQESQPVLLIAQRLRAPFQMFVSKYFPQVAVLSYDEVPTGTDVKMLKVIN